MRHDVDAQASSECIGQSISFTDGEQSKRKGYEEDIRGQTYLAHIQVVQGRTRVQTEPLFIEFDTELFFRGVRRNHDDTKGRTTVKYPKKSADGWKVHIMRLFSLVAPEYILNSFNYYKISNTYSNRENA